MKHEQSYPAWQFTLHILAGFALGALMQWASGDHWPVLRDSALTILGVLVLCVALNVVRAGRPFHEGAAYLALSLALLGRA